jgi:hypothetical protein
LAAAGRTAFSTTCQFAEAGFQAPGMNRQQATGRLPGKIKIQSRK